jgi:hypothetical protein
MYRLELRDWGGSRRHDGGHALQCIACGDIVDPVIEENRRGAGRAASSGLRKTRDGRRRFAVIV